MDLILFFNQVIERFKQDKLTYALAGGLVASVYRSEKRLTMDLDFLFWAPSDTQNRALQFIESFGLKPVLIRKADLEGGPLFAIKQKSTEPYIVAGRIKGDPAAIGLDLILPQMPWFESALARAENNQIDFGFGPVNCITVEDLILSKFFSLKNNPQRFKDLDDLQSVFSANHDLDLSYIYQQMHKINVAVPKEIKSVAPHVLTVVMKK